MTAPLPEEPFAEFAVPRTSALDEFKARIQQDRIASRERWFLLALLALSAGTLSAGGASWAAGLSLFPETLGILGTALAGTVIGLLVGWLAGVVSWAFARSRSRYFMSMSVAAELTSGNRWDRMSVWLALWGTIGIGFGAATGASSGVSRIAQRVGSDAIALWSWGGAFAGIGAGFVLWLFLRRWVRPEASPVAPALPPLPRMPLAQEGSAASPAEIDPEALALSPPDQLTVPHLLKPAGKEKNIVLRLLGLMLLVFLLFYGCTAVVDWVWWGPTVGARLAREKAMKVNNEGVEHYQAGDLDKARESLTQAIELDPQLALAYENRGLLSYDQGNWEEAIRDCTRALELDPQQAESYMIRGLAQLRRYEDDEAKKDFDRYRALRPESAGALERAIRSAKEERIRKR